MNILDLILPRVDMTVSLQVCEAGVAHAFVEKSGGRIARVVAAWEASK